MNLAAIKALHQGVREKGRGVRERVRAEGERAQSRASGSLGRRGPLGVATCGQLGCGGVGDGPLKEVRTDEVKLGRRGCVRKQKGAQADPGVRAPARGWSESTAVEPSHRCEAAAGPGARHTGSNSGAVADCCRRAADGPWCCAGSVVGSQRHQQLATLL